MVGEYALHTLRSEPRDARVLAERELRTTVLEPGEQLRGVATVFERSPLEYFRATRGVLALTSERIVYLGLAPRDPVATIEGPPAFEQRDFPIDTLTSLRTGRALFGLVPGVTIRSPKAKKTLALPRDAVPDAKRLAEILDRDHRRLQAVGVVEYRRQMATARAKKIADSMARAERWHVVQRGEALASIAHRYNTTAENIQAWNQLPDNRIKAGQRLLVKRRS